MSDVRDWGRFVRGRWNWTEFGYEQGLPRRSAFGDIDASLELGGHHLIIETKLWNGTGQRPAPPFGQMLALERMVSERHTVWLLWGCGCCDNPQALRDLGTRREYDWRSLAPEQRHIALKSMIDGWARWADA